MRRSCILVAGFLLVASSANAAAPADQLHPGDAIFIGDVQCTVSFKFAGSDGQHYMSTAGHCVLDDEEGPRTWAGNNGPAVRTSGDHLVGHVVFAEERKSDETRARYDFALFRLAPGVRASAAVREYGVPTGINDNRSEQPVTLRVYGQGFVLGSVRPARELVAPKMPHRDHAYAHGPLAPGDSGGPVLDTEGRAVGVVTGIGPRIGGGHLLQQDASGDTAPMVITRLSQPLAHASAALRLRFRLAQ